MSSPASNALLRRLPALDVLLGSPAGRAAAEEHGRALVASELRRRLDALRSAVRDGSGPNDPDSVERAGLALVDAAAAALRARAAGGLRAVVNATGVLVHTNLGRAPLGPRALERIAERGGEALDLEFDLADGRRGARGRGCHALLAELTGAEDALVVNNCAAGLLLALNALARQRAVVVARGELVEIGGSFRLPEICEAAGVRLAEVGTTNRTRAEDYARVAADPAREAGLLLKVHPSNFRVVGFTEETHLEELVALGRERGLPVVMDAGSGALEDLRPWGVEGEPPVPEAVAAGADLVLFSGDKLLGGPQAGCVVGRREAVEACRRSPLFRVLRPGRLTLLALEATLWSHATGRFDEIPLQAMLRQDVVDVERRASALVRAVRAGAAPGLRIEVVEAVSQAGGGSSPRSTIPTRCVRVEGVPANRLARALRLGRPPVVGRIEDDAVLLDLRSVLPHRDEELAAAVSAALSAAPSAAVPDGGS